MPPRRETEPLEGHSSSSRVPLFVELCLTASIERFVSDPMWLSCASGRKTGEKTTGTSEKKSKSSGSPLKHEVGVLVKL